MGKPHQQQQITDKQNKKKMEQSINDFKINKGMRVQPNANKKYEQILQESEAEFKRKGNFKMIFPFGHANVCQGVFKSLYEDEQSKILNRLLLERFQLKGLFKY